ncbi:MAG: hypothetical protein WBL50_11895 [Candidatus Acidiferrum sp.]
MHIDALVANVQKVVERLRVLHGDFKFAMFYNETLDAPSNWNLIVSSDWTDQIGTVEATKVIARELHQDLSIENRPAISRVTVLGTTDPFVRDMTRLYPTQSRQGAFPLSQLSAGGVTDGAGFIFYSQPEIPA